MRNLIRISFCCFMIGFCSSTNDFQIFKIKYNKTYHNEAENIHRLRIFENNVALINKHNAEAAAGKQTHKLSVNQFADLTNEEWINQLDSIDQKPRSEIKVLDNNRRVPRPDSIDWRDEGCVTAVIDQGPLGISWTISATGAMDGALCIKEDELVALSSLNIQECCQSCMSVQDSFEYTRDNGINTASDYPPFPIDGSCKFDESNQVVTIEDYAEIDEGNEESLTDKIATEGPISVCIDASSIMFYSSGVYYDPNCSTTSLNHCMLAVGYGSLTDAEYYIVKNSWGSSWGESGYIRMSRNRDNNCGIATDASWPIV